MDTATTTHHTAQDLAIKIVANANALSESAIDSKMSVSGLRRNAIAAQPIVHHHLRQRQNGARRVTHRASRNARTKNGGVDVRICAYPAALVA